MNLKNIRTWHDKLLADEYVQTAGTLRADSESKDGQYEHCCLGVACDLAAPHRWNDHDHDGNESVLSDPAMRWLGVEDRNPKLLIPEHLRRIAGGRDEAPATFLNDTYAFTFTEIAECIKETWPEAFI